MLEIADLHVRYGVVAALKGISLEVSQGEIVGLIGANGAGKTTTLASIFGLAAPASGSVTFEGRSLVGMAPERIVRQGLALVPEGRQIFQTLTVAENLQLGLTPRQDVVDVALERQRVFELFPVLEDYLHQTAGRLSGGEQQQLAIARALLSRPKLLLLDEPSLGLAPLVIDVLFETLAALRDDGVTVLLVEQNASRTMALADRTYVLRNGTVSVSGTRSELAGRTDLAQIYLGV
ncbi:MAG: transporter related protein [Conexibacter sp.]|nr:transporter related protein [Conexibacter sp.]